MPLNPLLALEPLVFVDLETSGANFASDRVIEVGLVEVDADGVREWSVLVNPEAPISPFITRLTGIDDAMVGSAPTFRQLAPTLLDRLRGRLLVAHNARFDYGFLQCEFKRLGVEFRTPTLCTVKLSRKLFPEHHRHNLDALVTRHGLKVAGNRHRALADARILWELWQCWHKDLASETVRSAVATIVGRPELPPQIDAAVIDDLPEAAGAYAFLGADGRRLLVRRTGNVRQQVLAHFAAANRDTALIRDTGASSGAMPPAKSALACTRSNSRARPPPSPGLRRNLGTPPANSVPGNFSEAQGVASGRNSFSPRIAILLLPTTCSACTRIVARPCAPCAGWPMASACATSSWGSKKRPEARPVPLTARRTAVAPVSARRPPPCMVPAC